MMEKDLSELTKNELHQALDELEKALSEKQAKVATKERKEQKYSDLIKTISETEKEIKKQEQKLLDIHSMETQKLKESENFISEEKYIESRLEKKKEAKKPIKKKEKNRNQWFLTTGVFVIILYNIMLLIANVTKFISKGDLVALDIVFVILVLPLVFGFFKQKIASIISCLFIVLFFISMKGDVRQAILLTFIFLVLSILLVIIAEKLFGYYKQLPKQSENPGIHKNKTISELKEQYQQERDRHFKNKEKRQEEIKEKYDAQRREVNNSIELLNERLEREKQEQVSLVEELKIVTNDLKKGFVIPLHKDYQDTNIIELFKEYLEKGRCDNLKECINLYEQEKANQQLRKQIVEVEKHTEEKVSGVRREVQDDLSKAKEQIQDLDVQVSKVGKDIEEMNQDKAIEKEASRKMSYDSYEKKYGKKEAKKLEKNWEVYDKELEKYKEQVKNKNN